MKKRLYIWFIVLTIILMVVSLLSLSVGSTPIPFREVINIFLNGGESIERSIIFDIRLPRILLGFAVGGVLSLAGVILQGIFRNPLVEPYTLGISGGAAVGVSLNIVFKAARLGGILTMPLSGFAGAVTAALIVYRIGVKSGRLDIKTLLLSGVLLSFITSSLIMLLMALSRAEDLHGIIFWTMGSLDEPNPLLIRLALASSLFGLVIAYLFSRPLNALALGEEEARHLGVDTEGTKKALFLLASFLTGVSVSIAGVIGFVGLVVPHFIRLFVGSDHRILLITSFLGGGIFLIFSDMLARTIISPMELPVGVITGIVGGTIFVYALTKKRLLLG